jgi:GNAT superfamily N-acetyltransferase
MGQPRWRTVSDGELETVVERLRTHPDGIDGPVRHMFPLSVVEGTGTRSLRVVTSGARWAVAVVFPGRLLVPAGDPDLLRRAGEPSRRWRLLVGDRAACDAVLAGADLRGTIVHDQRLLSVVPELVPSAQAVADPGIRLATRQDLPVLAELAVQLHIDDDFGPDPGRAGLRGYARRIGESVDRGLVWCVGPPGAPVAKLERSVSSRRWGIQLAGIVVAPDARGQGIGAGMVAAAVREALAGPGQGGNALTLHVRAENTPALRAYAHAGFVDREAWRLAVRT